MSNRRTVLLVDDDPGTRHMLQYGLKKAMGAIEVVVANSGREAIGLLEHRAIDVVVTDLAMPVGDAFSLIAYMNNSRSPIPVIALSVLDSEAVAKRLASLWSLRVVQKPASYQEVAAAATEALEFGGVETVERIPLDAMLALIEAERRSCTMIVTSGTRKGRLHFDSGRLVNAFSDDFGAEGEAAARDVLGWSDTSIDFEHLPDAIRTLIETPLASAVVDVAAATTGARVEGALETPANDVAPGREHRSSDGVHAAALETAMTRLAERIAEAGQALEAVGNELRSFRDARRELEALTEGRELRRLELEACHDDVARLARELLGRVDGLFSASASDRHDGADRGSAPSERLATND